MAPGAEVAPGAEEQGYWAISEGLAAFESRRDVVKVAGPDAERYLQGQLSQDLAPLVPGAWAWSLVLQPQGKLDALVRVYRVAADEFLLDTDAGVGEALVERLTRFRLRTKATVELLGWKAIAVRGPSAAATAPAATATAATATAATSASGTIPPVASGQDGAVAVPFAWDGLAGYDLLGPAPRWPTGATRAGPGAYEAARIEAGFPCYGTELDERTIPAEAGLVEAAVSFTKGCYTGQELVARIDSRGSNVPRNLRGLRLSGPAQPGARLHPVPHSGDRHPDGEAAPAPAKEVGRLTSVAWSPRNGWVALGYVGRSVAIGQTLAVGMPPGEVGSEKGWAGEVPAGEVLAEVCLLPFGPVSA